MARCTDHSASEMRSGLALSPSAKDGTAMLSARNMSRRLTTGIELSPLGHHINSVSAHEASSSGFEIQKSGSRARIAATSP